MITLQARIRELVDLRLEDSGHMFIDLGPLVREGHDGELLVEIWTDVCTEFADDPRWIYHKVRPAPHAGGSPERFTVDFPT